MDIDVAGLREHYAQARLDIVDANPDPIIQFKTWFSEAHSSNIKEPNAMILGTCGFDMMPETRTVLLKAVDNRGFVFYTNYNSEKGKQLAENARCSLLFVWLDLERQIRIKGDAVKVSREESEDYFKSRPRESQIGAWTSPQSQEIPSRTYLEELYSINLEKFGEEQEIALPEFWGGYLVIPSEIEFWQGRPSRLHDRICYKRIEDNWQIVRLAP